MAQVFKLQSCREYIYHTLQSNFDIYQYIKKFLIEPKIAGYTSFQN